MPMYAGNSGVVRLGASGLVAEVQSFEVTTEADLIATSAMGTTWEGQLDTGRRRWSGTVTCYYDRSDADGQNALALGTSVALNLFPDGIGAGKPVISGNARARQRVVPSEKDGIVMLTIPFAGDGACTEGVQP